MISMGILGILRESIKIPLQNLELSLSLALLTIIPSFLLFLCSDIFLRPVAIDLALKAITLQTTDPQSPEYVKLLDEIKDDVRVVFRDLAIFSIFSFLTRVIASVTTIYAWAAAYLGKGLSLGELFQVAWRRWKRPVITQLYITLFSLGYITVAAASFGGFAFLAKGSAPLFALLLLVAVLSIVLFHYLTVVWKMGFVISVLEEGLYGLGAIQRAGEILKGRKLQGFGLYLLLALPGIPMGVLQNKIAMQPEAVRLAVGAANIVVVMSLLSLFVEAVSTVFYYDCRKSQGEVVELEGSFGYSMVPTTTHVDGDVP